MPTISVHRGVSEFRIPARELSIPRWAAANKKAGARLPTTPTIKKIANFRELRPLRRGNAKGSKNSQVITTLNAPTSPGENTSRPRFIRINELPQVRASKTSMSQGSQDRVEVINANLLVRNNKGNNFSFQTCKILDVLHFSIVLTFE